MSRYYSGKKSTVEESLVFDLDFVLRRGKFVTLEDGTRLGTGTLTSSWAGTVRSSFGFMLWLHETDAKLQLSYAVSRTGEGVNDWFTLVSRRPHFGGRRFFVTCPCGRRVVKLYLPSGGNRFRCRDCYRLTYESRQKHNKRMDFFLKNPLAAEAAMNSMLSGGRIDFAAFKAEEKALSRFVDNLGRSRH